MKLKKSLPLWTRFLSFFSGILIKNIDSPISRELKLECQFGKLMLNAGKANYSNGSLEECFSYAFQKSDIYKSEWTNVLVLGLGLGSVIQLLENSSHKPAKYLAVELDPSIIELFEELYEYDRQRMELVEANAYDHLMNSDGSYDLIIIDVFVEMNMPDWLAEESVIEKIKLLSAKHFFVNTIIQNQRDKYVFDSIKAALQSVFREIQVFHPKPENRVIYAKMPI